MLIPLDSGGLNGLSARIYNNTVACNLQYGISSGPGLSGGRSWIRNNLLVGNGYGLFSDYSQLIPALQPALFISNNAFLFLVWLRTMATKIPISPALF